ncbi:MAG: quinone oxidoreductase [Collimonas sp.]|uniref:quinone oxidoreductase family protein n=1 Tax=Collimonas sp. TaxID=1963772 RepID=UPI0032671A3F
MSKELVMRIAEVGDAGGLQAETVDLAPPAAGEVRVRHTAIGVNFADIYHRIGLYRLPELPAVLGVEAAGVVEALGGELSGQGCGDLQIGDRVVYAGLPAGAYATARNVAFHRLVRIPAGVTDINAAATLLRGITAHMLFQYVRKVQAGDTVLVQAAAGGLGQVLGQWGAALGARMIGTVGSEAKGEIARSKGYQEAIPYRQMDFVAETMRLTGDRGVDFAIDGVGGETLSKTLQTVRPFGMAASVGQAGAAGSEDNAALPLSDLGPYRSLSLARPSVFRFMSNISRYREGAAAALAHMADGLAIDVSLRLPLEKAAEAQRLLESGKTAGGIILLPD